MGVGIPVEVAPGKLQPAVPIRKSVTDDFIICLEDGKKFRSLKRHLQSAYNLTPDQYFTLLLSMARAKGRGASSKL